MKKDKRILTTLLFAVCGSMLLSSCNKEANSSSSVTNSSSVNSSSSVTSDSSSNVTSDSSSNVTSDSSSNVTTSSSSSSIHKHVYADEWSKNEEGHYKDCTCHSSEIVILDHEDDDKNGICDICEYVIEEVKTYTIVVQDHLNNPIAGAEVKFTNLGEEITLTTNEEGRAITEYIYVDEVKATVLSVPAGYIINDDVNEFVLVANEEVFTNNIDKNITYTIYTKRENGESLKNAKVELMKDDQVIASKVTDETGIVTFDIREDEYKVVISHLNEAYTLKDSNDIMLNKENTTYTAVFEESKEWIGYQINFFDNEGNALRPEEGEYTCGKFFIFDKYGECEGTFAINSAGYSVSNMVNDDYYLTIFASGGTQFLEIKKDDPSNLNVVLDVKENIGASEDNPFLVYNLVDLPYIYDDNFPYNWNYEFEANQTVYARVPKALGTYFSIDGSKFTVSYNDKELVPNDSNRIETYFEDVEYGEDVILKITAKEAAVEDIEYINYSSPNKEKDLYSVNSDKIETCMYYYEGQVRYYTFYVYDEYNENLVIETENLTYEIETTVREGYTVYNVKVAAETVGEGSLKILFKV